MSILVGLMEKGLLPDTLIRRGIRRLLRKRLQDEDHGCVDVNRGTCDRESGFLFSRKLLGEVFHHCVKNVVSVGFGERFK